MPDQESTVVPMTKELAEIILQLGIAENQITGQKFDIRRKLGVYSWEDAQHEAMKFLLQGKI